MPHRVASNPPKAATFRVKSALVALIGAALLTPFMAQSPALAAVGLDLEEAAFCTLINNYRATQGLPALMVSESLTNASEWHSTDMANKNYFSHTDSLGRGALDRMAAFGYPYSWWGENVAAGNSTASATFVQWKNSPGHNSNMLNSNFKVLGIGKASNPNSTYKHYWTTDFGGLVDPGAVPCPGGGTTPPPPLPTYAITIADVSMAEGSSRRVATNSMTFTVKISSPSTQAVKVNYSTSNGTALAGVDYTAALGTLTIPAGATSAKVAVPVVKDRVREANETFLVNLSTPVNATIADATAVGTILNDD